MVRKLLTLGVDRYFQVCYPYILNVAHYIQSVILILKNSEVAIFASPNAFVDSGPVIKYFCDDGYFIEVNYFAPLEYFRAVFVLGILDGLIS